MFDWLKTTFLAFLGPAITFFATVLNPLIALTVGVWELLQWGYDLIGQGNEAMTSAKEKYTAMMTLVGGSVFGNLPGQLGQAIGFLNAFLPVTEALVLIALGVVLYTACIVLRVIKSWIPTIG